jgi:hypothetical protein
MHHNCMSVTALADVCCLCYGCVAVLQQCALAAAASCSSPCLYMKWFPTLKVLSGVGHARGEELFRHLVG